MVEPLVRATFTAFVADHFQLQQGDLYPADDPLVVQHPDWFSDDLEPVIHRTGPPVRRKPRNVATRPLDEVTE